MKKLSILVTFLIAFVFAQSQDTIKISQLDYCDYNMELDMTYNCESVTANIFIVFTDSTISIKCDSLEYDYCYEIVFVEEHVEGTMYTVLDEDDYYERFFLVSDFTVMEIFKGMLDDYMLIYYVEEY